MLRLPKNKPEDEGFIRRAHQDQNWPENLDKPQDWRKVSIFSKIWFRIGGFIKALASLTIITVAVVACHEVFIGSSSSIDDICSQTSNGCSDR